MVATIRSLGSAAEAVAYFRKDDYYVSNDTEHRRYSFWVGKAAEEMGLHKARENPAIENISNELTKKESLARQYISQVNKTDFQNLLDGYVKTSEVGQRLGRRYTNEATGKLEHQHKAGIEITFSAPKSVSAEYAFYRRTLMMEAHKDAVCKTLLFVEKELLQTRGYDQASNTRPRMNSPSMAAACFTHDVNRNLDPQLHTHCVIANMTHAPDGKWKSVDFGKINNNRQLIGAYYRNELAKNILEKGYDITPQMRGRVSSFEIAGYERKDLDILSSRQNEILAYMAEHNIPYTAHNAHRVGLITRQQKIHMPRKELDAEWRKQAQDIGFDLDKSPAPRMRGKEADMDQVRATGEEYGSSALLTVHRSIERLEERATIIGDHKIKAEALAKGVGRLSLEEIDKAIEQLKEDKIIHEVPKEKTLRARADRIFVTDKALKAEHEIISTMHDSKGQAEPILADSKQIAYSRDDLSKGQIEAIELALTSRDFVIGVQGTAGTGKTTMLEQALENMPHNQMVIALAPTDRAVDVLQTLSGTQTRTLQYFLTKYGDDRSLEVTSLQGARIILDEASMVSRTQMKELFEISHNLGIEQVMLVGDTRQLRSIQAGQPFRQLQEAGMETAMMQDIKRQKGDDLRLAVEAVSAGRPGLALNMLDKSGSLHEVESPAQTAVDLWLSLNQSDRDATAILAQTHAIRAEVNGEIRAELINEGVLHGRTREITRYDNLHFSNEDKRDTSQYESGMVLAFRHNVMKGGTSHEIFQKGGHYEITDIDRENNLLHLVNVVDENDTPSIDMNKPRSQIFGRFSVFEQNNIEIMVGETIRFTHDDVLGGVSNGAIAEIESIHRGIVTLSFGYEVMQYHLNDPALGHIDYGYSRTIHSVQGETHDNVIVVADATPGMLNNQQSLYVAISRASEDAIVLTDNVEQLEAILEANSGDALTAIEALGYDHEVELAPLDLEELGKAEQIEIAERMSERMEVIDGIDPITMAEQASVMAEMLEQDAEVLSIDSEALELVNNEIIATAEIDLFTEIEPPPPELSLPDTFEPDLSAGASKEADEKDKSKDLEKEPEREKVKELSLDDDLSL